MKHQVCFQWIEPCPNERLKIAQENLLQSVVNLELEPLLYPAGSKMVKFTDILSFARTNTEGTSFVWCNSDVNLLRNPFEVDNGKNVHGFHRAEVPSGAICRGVDMYLIPCKAWDDYLGVNPPDLWCGATHVDWWLSRSPALRGSYQSHFGYIDHLTHSESPASKGGNELYRHNIREYNRWAHRNGAGLFEELIDLPIVGRSLSPITDLLKRLRNGS